MHHFFVEKEDILGEHIRLHGDNARHLGKVLRARVGERVIISDQSDSDYVCEVEELLEDRVQLKILFTEAVHELPADVILYQGLPKSDKMELIIQKAVELGVSRIVPLETKNTVVRLEPKKARSKLERWQGIAAAAAKQSKRSQIPEISPVSSWKEAMQEMEQLDFRMIPYENARGCAAMRELLEEIRGSLAAADSAVDASDAEIRLSVREEAEGRRNQEKAACGTKRKKIAVIIGPEGGFSEEEIRDALCHKVLPVSLGKRILRTETAAITALSLVMMALEDEGSS